MFFGLSDDAEYIGNEFIFTEPKKKKSKVIKIIHENVKRIKNSLF
jgi:hypothetical protein